VARPLVSDLRRGSEIAGYRIEALLGRGGMGVVYLAEDLALGRKVALKLLAPELAEDERFRTRFLVESRLAASIDHSHIVPIYEAGEADGRLFIAMRYVEGTDLATILAVESPMAPDRALSIVEQVADALDAAHQRDLVHRDVKPANILVTTEGGREHCYLGDFGLSRQVVGDAGPAEHAQLSGTPDYVAPEQIRKGPLNPAVDVYSLGCVLFECLTGQKPFSGESPLAVLFAHVAEDPPQASVLNPSLPPGIDDVFARALAKTPEERQASCRELVEDARAELGLPGETGLAAFISRRAPLILALSGLLVVGVAVLAFFLVRGEPSTPPPLQVDSLARIDPQTNELAATVPIGSSPTGVAAGERWVWAANFDDETVSQIDSETNSVARTIVVDGSPLAVAVGEGAVWVTSTREGDTVLTKIDPVSGAVRRERELGTGLALVGVGEGSVWLAVGDLAEDTVLRLSPDTGAVEETIPLPNRAGAVVFGEAALWVAGAGLDGLVWRIDPTTNELTAIPLDFRAEDIAAGEGAVWVTNRGAGSVSRIDPATNTVVETVAAGRGAVGIAVGEGAVWVANSADRTVSRIDPGTGEIVETIDVDARLGDVAVGAGGVWVTAEAN
jgi:YVTN family beta-propeller protein